MNEYLSERLLKGFKALLNTECYCQPNSSQFVIPQSLERIIDEMGLLRADSYVMTRGLSPEELVKYINEDVASELLVETGTEHFHFILHNIIQQIIAAYVLNQDVKIYDVIKDIKNLRIL